MRLWNASLFSEASGAAPFMSTRTRRPGMVVRTLGCVTVAVPVSSGVAVPFHSDRRIALLGCIRPGTARPRSTRRAKELPNKRMQLTKLRAAPERQDKVPPCAPAGQTDGGTASQLIRSVRRTLTEGEMAR